MKKIILILCGLMFFSASSNQKIRENTPPLDITVDPMRESLNNAVYKLEAIDSTLVKLKK